ncbi:amt-3 [Symbiodinium pilosum]|uniref:Amt-3 protein n=1 Tax=Symbiodinium pilosum TaxID=2952 RepID=A0A812P0M0_SYMPI|nr:amt-3 [Symbiodinium pilosum]
MQSGFGMLEMGSAAKGHEVMIMLKNVYDVVFGALAYYAFGFGISWGSPSNSFMGLGRYFLDITSDDYQNTGVVFSSFIFQFSFAATSTTIVSGCVAMRCRFEVYCLYSFYAVLVYAFVAHWVWASNGWLAQLGVHDFAGSGPVHLLGAASGLNAILWLGPRRGRFDGTVPREHFKPSSPENILFGLFMLWWGWIGFNCGSSFGITGLRWIVATRAGVTTICSTAGGGSLALVYTKIKNRGKRLNAEEVANGILGSLVAITATCACVHPPEARAGLVDLDIGF